MKKTAITKTIKVSPELGRFLEENQGQIGKVFKENGYFGKHSVEIGKMPEFLSDAQALAYLLGSHNWEVEEPLYYLKVLDDCFMYVNLNIENGDIMLCDELEQDNWKTRFTQAEIDANEKLKKFEPWKVEVAE